MDPILSWVVCMLSAFLLTAGGFLLARAVSSRRLAGHEENVAKLKATLQKFLEERKVLQARERELTNRLNGAERALKAQSELLAERDGFGAPTELPAPQSYFGRESAPLLQKVSENEFEIPDAASRGVRETALGAEHSDGLDAHEETKQFNLHSPENVVQFMQRIDELTEENADLRSEIAEHEHTIKERRAEGNEQIHRYAALDATTEKLRGELKRRNERIKFLEEQLKDQLASDDGPLTNPNEPPQPPLGVEPEVTAGLPGPPPPPPPPPHPPSPPASFVVGKSAMNVSGPHDGPTLPVQKISPDELEGDEK